MSTTTAVVEVTMTVRDGVQACAGVCDNGWYGGILLIEERDEGFRRLPDCDSFAERAAHARRWTAVTAGQARRIKLMSSGEDGIDSRCVAAAERIEGPVAPRERVARPMLAWVERSGRQWHLMLHKDGRTTVVLSRGQVIRCPRVAMTAIGPCLAFETDTGPAATQVEVVSSLGCTLHRVAGREPVLCVAGGPLVLCTEKVGPDGIALRLERLGTKDDGAAVELWMDGSLLHADMAWSEPEQVLYLASEQAPLPGSTCQMGAHRSLPVWRWSLKDAPEPLGELPVEPRAFQSIGVENMPPVRPSVQIDDGQPVVLFKQHRFTGFRAFGWDIFRCRRRGDGWSEPERLTPSTTTSDADFGWVREDDRFIGLFPAHENEGGRGSQRSRNRRVELVTAARSGGLPRFEIPAEKRAPYRVPTGFRDVSPEPPALATSYKGRQLIWGDLHIHSIFSKCVAAVDGDPRENIRLARDVLGCRVIALAEHTPHTTGPESTWLYDQLESTVGRDNVLLYASEPGIERTRHMNFYCRDRDTFERLERILIAQGRRYPEVLRQVREDLPADSVFVMRHVHGQPIPDEQILQHFDPQFEVAMEAMQGRGNAMLEVVEKCPMFPQPFLDSGCKIGLVGGTDHFREWAPNHFCLTGFWVREVSVEGVWEAIRNRYTFAMSDARVALSTTCKGVPMGGTVTVGEHEPLRIRVEASCGRRIRRLTLMRNGLLLPWVEVNATHAAIELVDEDAKPGSHWYVVTAEVETAFGNHTGFCHASPYFAWKA